VITQVFISSNALITAATSITSAVFDESRLDANDTPPRNYKTAATLRL